MTCQQCQTPLPADAHPQRRFCPDCSLKRRQERDREKMRKRWRTSAAYREKNRQRQADKRRRRKRERELDPQYIEGKIAQAWAWHEQELEAVAERARKSLCRQCGRPLPDGRSPQQRYCADCKEAQQARQREASRDRYRNDPAVRERQAAYSRIKNRDPAYRALKREAERRLRLDPAERQRRNERDAISYRTRMLDPAYRELQREIDRVQAQARMADPAYREHKREQARGRALEEERARRAALDIDLDQLAAHIERTLREVGA
jgi:hypothetical protein